MASFMYFTASSTGMTSVILKNAAWQIVLILLPRPMDSAKWIALIV